MSGNLTPNSDLEQLRMLSIFHYVLGGFIAVTGSVPTFILILLLGLFSWEVPSSVPPGPDIYLGFGLTLSLLFIALLLVWAVAIALILAGYYLSNRQHYTYCMFVAAISCLFTPLGTILGILTIVVLTRDSVRALFEQR